MGQNLYNVYTCSTTQDTMSVAVLMVLRYHAVSGHLDSNALPNRHCAYPRMVNTALLTVFLFMA